MVVRREDPDQVPSAFPNQNQAPGPSLLRRQQRHLTGLLAWETCGLSVFFGLITYGQRERYIYIYSISIYVYMYFRFLYLYMYMHVCMHVCIFVKGIFIEETPSCGALAADLFDAGSQKEQLQSPA